jgi:hypothetical protein
MDVFLNKQIAVASNSFNIDPNENKKIQVYSPKSKDDAELKL